jgi:hypothetical protein
MTHSHASKLRLREDLLDFLANRLGILGGRLDGGSGCGRFIALCGRWQQRHEREACDEDAPQKSWETFTIDAIDAPSPLAGADRVG